MCMAPANPVKQYRTGGIQSVMTPVGLPTFTELRKDPKAALAPKLAISRIKNVNTSGGGIA